MEIFFAIVVVVSAVLAFTARRLGGPRIGTLLGSYWFLCFLAWAIGYPEVGAIVALAPAIVLRLVLSIKADKDRTRMIINERAKNPSYRGALLCPKCGVVVFPDMQRCKECGASLLATTRIQREGR
jgi:hypothetical protein